MTTTGIKIGRFEWTTRVEGGDEFIYLSVGGVEVGYVSHALGAPAYDWMLTLDSWACNPAPIPTFSAAKEELAKVVRAIIAATPGNDMNEYYGGTFKPLPYSHIAND